MTDEEFLKKRIKWERRCGDSLVAWVEFEPGDQIMTTEGLLTIGGPRPKTAAEWEEEAPHRLAAS